MVAVPRDSATLILLRNSGPSHTGLEVLMLRRHSDSSFLPGAYVFPGGVVEAGDYTPNVEELCTGVTFEKAREIVDAASPPQKALGFFVAAIRETFEESGVLLAYGPSTDLITNGGEKRIRFARYRKRIQEGPFSFIEMMRKEGLRLATDKLFYFSHWITPEMAPTRFDTRFFVAAAPLEQEASHDETETTDSRWVSPKEVLEKRKIGELTIAYPTYRNIGALAEFSSVHEVIASTRRKEVPGIQPLVNMLTFG